jgi:chromate transporter
VERLRSNQHLTAALTGITAAVVGVIANLALFFALHNLFAETHEVQAGPLYTLIPVLSTWKPAEFALTGVALLAIFWRGWSTLRTLGVCAVLGLGLGLLGLT